MVTWIPGEIIRINSHDADEHQISNYYLTYGLTNEDNGALITVEVCATENEDYPGEYSVEVFTYFDDTHGNCLSIDHEVADFVPFEDIYGAMRRAIESDREAALKGAYTWDGEES